MIASIVARAASGACWLLRLASAGAALTAAQAMDDVRFRLSERTLLAKAADRYLASRR